MARKLLPLLLFLPLLSEARGIRDKSGFIYLAAFVVAFIILLFIEPWTNSKSKDSKKEAEEDNLKQDE